MTAAFHVCRRAGRWPAAPAIVLVLGLLLCAGAAAELPVAELNLADRVLTVEIAATPETMSRGLMFRDSMPEHHGMLFIWPRDQMVAMWMKNTRIPLSVAFIDRDFRILNIARMEPHSLEIHPSAGAARYALELNQGWFERHGVTAGDSIDGLGRLLSELPEDP